MYGAAMITPEEIQSIEIFAELGREGCEQVARVAADISLEAGDEIGVEFSPSRHGRGA